MKKPRRRIYPNRVPTTEQDRALTFAFGRLIRTYRKEARLTLEQMAVVIGTCSSRLHKLEKGRVSPWLGDLLTFARLFGFTETKLLPQVLKDARRRSVAPRGR